jgi:hypothetical protein
MYFVEITDNSTYTNDLSFAISNINLYNTLSGDDTKITVNLTNSFIYNNVPYNIIYINSNGTIGFNLESNTNSFLPYYSTASNMSAFFLPWADTNTPTQIYYREDINLKTFTLIYDRTYYYGIPTPYKVGIKLFLDGSGKAIINFGQNANISVDALLGFSFASKTTSTFITNSLTGNFTPLQSPLVNIIDNQSFYTNKQIIITFQANQVTPTITNFSIPTKIFGDVPFQITQPTSNSDGPFSYTSSNTSVATISDSTITIVGVGTSIITATQAATVNYTSGSTTTTFQVNQATPINPVIITNGLLYFMNTSSTYAYITNSLEINYDLIASSYKVLTGNNIKITNSNN